MTCLKNWFIELHRGYDLYYKLLAYQFMHLTPWLNVWLARPWLWFLNCMSVFERYGITLAHIGILIWHSLIDCVNGFCWSCNALIVIGFLLGLLKLWFIRYMDIHAYLLMPMTSIVTIGMLVTYINTLGKLWTSVVTLARNWVWFDC